MTATAFAPADTRDLQIWLSGTTALEEAHAALLDAGFGAIQSNATLAWELDDEYDVAEASIGALLSAQVVVFIDAPDPVDLELAMALGLPVVPLADLI